MIKYGGFITNHDFVVNDDFIKSLNNDFWTDPTSVDDPAL